MEKQILEIIKEKDTYKISVEISENSKQEPSITIKVHTDGSAKEAVDEALKEYRRAKKELTRAEISNEDFQDIGSLTCNKAHTHTKRCLN